MEEQIDAELKRKSEAIAQGLAMMRNVVSNLEQDFSKSQEGKEAALIDSILKKYVDSPATFLTEFISGKHGERNLDVLIAELEHPKTEVKVDKKLIGILKRLSDDLKRLSIPSQSELVKYNELKRDIRSLSTSSDIQQFNKGFDRIVNDVPKETETDVNRILAGKSPGSMPATVRLRNSRVNLLVWGFVYSRLSLPPVAFEGAAEFEEMIAKKMDVKSEVLRKESGLVNDKEDDDWNNWKEFSKQLKSKGNSHIICKILEKTGERDSANELLIKGVAGGREAVLRGIKSHIDLMSSREEIEKTEVAARAELLKILSSYTESLQKSIEELRAGFSHSLKKRIEELEKSHSKSLADAEGMKDNLESLNKNVLLASELGIEDTKRMEAVDRSENELMKRALDIAKVARARVILNKFEIGIVDEIHLKTDFEGLINSGLAGFASEAISRMKNMHEKRASGEMNDEQYSQSLKNMDAFIAKLMAQLDQVCNELNKLAERKVKIAEEHDELKARALEDFDKTYAAAEDSVNRMRKSGYSLHDTETKRGEYQ